MEKSSLSKVEHLHMSGIAETDATLIGTLITAVLQTNHTMSGSQLLLRETAYIFVRFLRADGWFSIIARL